MIETSIEIYNVNWKVGITPFLATSSKNDVL